MLRLRLLPIVVVAVGVALTAARPAHAQVAGTARGVLTGVVVDSADGKPLRGAEVRVQRLGLRVATDSAGRFVLRGLGRGAVQAKVDRGGYEGIDVRWERVADSAAVRVSLVPSVIALAEIRVQTTALDVLMRSAASAVWTVGESELEGSTASDALQAIEDRVGLRPVACRAVLASRTDGRGCYYVRGTPTRVCVLVDEARAPGGLEELAAFRPDEIGRIYIFRGGSVVAVYSRWYLKQAARKHETFRSIDFLTTSECPSG
ncbi:MAG TPA: carboxypeptidase regulatory-like domain-containing protein [Longimicrobiaceae bacterium]|nr:carboxypeptidase regulatory-like domain-containing protein [Longimicrobiaceae bacterium]